MSASDPHSHDAVTVLIPSYRPDHRFVRTLESIRDQTHRAVWMTASIDPAPDHTMPELPQFPNLTVIHRPTRLGWVGNTNALLGTVRTPLFLMLSHDDTLTPDYLEKCVAALLEAPEAIVAHGSVRHYGLRQDAQTTASISGTRFERIKAFFRRNPHHAELGWRGVARSWLLERGLRLRAKRSDGHLSNTLWALESLCHGASIDVPGIFYDRFVEADGLSRTFHQRSLEERSVMLADNAACVLDAVAAAGLPPDETAFVLNAWFAWLLRLQGNWNVFADEARSDHRPLSELRPAIARFVANVVLSMATRDDEAWPS